LKRGGIFHYQRRVPSDVAELDARAPLVRLSLKTSDLAKAMSLRDIHERADNEYWASLLGGSDAEVAMKRYKAALSRASALGLTYRSAADIAMVEPVTTIVERIERAMAKPLPSVDKDVLVGMVSGPDKSVSKAIEFYFENIVPDVLCYKSED